MSFIVLLLMTTNDVHVYLKVCTWGVRLSVCPQITFQTACSRTSRGCSDAPFIKTPFIVCSLLPLTAFRLLTTLSWPRSGRGRTWLHSSVRLHCLSAAAQLGGKKGADFYCFVACGLTANGTTVHTLVSAS